ncbi:hypothetical protein M7I_0919 [Glarea lozoyensis 74030]|uniref:Uncharacterized protein n=1 Tax=Glarea lozoyensis (strain ATCC 74030 / MF5533) TaxID=1104152 RepID=H0EEN9_GLAL7|nr:hypothetical protein M7I_0919 [Glarea lozoyensis 74030]
MAALRMEMFLASNQHSHKGWLDKGTAKAANIWAGWEQKEKGWQKKVVDYGNQALKRIPYEEWGLKSIPALSTRKEAAEESGKDKVEVIFPASLIPESNVLDVLKKLGTERQSLHRKWLIGSFIDVPSAPSPAITPANVPLPPHQDLPTAQTTIQTPSEPPNPKRRRKEKPKEPEQDEIPEWERERPQWEQELGQSQARQQMKDHVQRPWASVNPPIPPPTRLPNGMNGSLPDRAWSSVNQPSPSALYGNGDSNASYVAEE